ACRARRLAALPPLRRAAERQAPRLLSLELQGRERRHASPGRHPVRVDRRAFPCWDEPAFKAVFAVTLAIDPALTAISNTRGVAERQEGGKKVLTFADTIKMSTYLVAFVVGDLEATDPVLVGEAPVRVWCVPGKRRLAAFGHDVAVASLGFFEAYYGLPYPGDKLDLLAI